ncbi:MAG: hypothetical protein JWM36_3204 [Hyphomicrobiales bacterium]|nr:hypothetical protein [Hyphomicrobiales bacterium]
MAYENDRSDLLSGYEEIGAYLGWTTRQAKHRAATGGLPTFKIGNIVCARRSSLDAWIAEREAEARGAATQEAR